MVLYIYTHMFGKRFEKELKLIEAYNTEIGEKALKTYLLPFVKKEAFEYIEKNKEFENMYNALIGAGWTHLPMAIKKYKERSEKMQQMKNDVYYFSSYFCWYARQGMLEYITKKHIY